VSLARVVVSGEVISDPEKRFTPNNNVAVTNLTLAVRSLGKAATTPGQETFQIRLTCWRQLAETCAEQVRAGDFLLVDGRLLMQSFELPDGSTKKGFEIEVSSLEKMAALPSWVGSSQAANTNNSNSSSASGGNPVNSFAASTAGSSGKGHSDLSADDLLTEDDIPF
jgi:single-strand DNA-binding protein